MTHVPITGGSGQKRLHAEQMPTAAPPLCPPAALSFERVSFGYGEAALTVRDVTTSIAPGEMVGLLGPNGAGKSTILKLASGVMPPRQGTIRIEGDDVRSLSRRELARRVAVIPQDFSVQFAYTVRQIVELGRLPHRGPLSAWGGPGAADRAAVAGALHAAHADDLAERVFNELSGGERQRVLVALALAQDARIVLLDEPTAHLDIKHQVEVLDLLRRMNRERGLTVVAALHDLNLAARYFPRLLLFRGEIVAEGPPAHVLDGALLSRVYETAVQVGILRGEQHLSVLPPGYPHDAPGERDESGARLPIQVHVVAGGGSGELLMRALADAEVPFSAGPLNIGDSDYALATRLARVCLAEPPYAPVSAAGVADAGERMRAAGFVVLCPTPLGPGNSALLDAAIAARRDGATIILLEPGLPSPDEAQVAWRAAVQSRDFSGCGVERYETLLAQGARWASNPDAVLAALKDAQQLC